MNAGSSSRVSATPATASTARSSGAALAASLGVKQFPVSLGDDLDVALGDFEGGLVVDRVGRPRDIGRPGFCLGHGVAGHAVGSEVWADREVDEAQRGVIAARRSPLDE